MMRKTIKAAEGELRVKICTDDFERLLNACIGADLTVWDVECSSAVTFFVSLYEKDMDRFEKIAALCMCQIEHTELRGGSADAASFRHRSLALALAAACALLLSISGLFIWDVEVIGNSSLSDAEILRALDRCGVREGCFWPATDAEMIRTSVLLAEPRLAWIGMNVSGSRARVLVLEREEKPEIYNESAAADIVASKDGVVCGVSVLNGRALVAEGTVVARGETLISGDMSSDGVSGRSVRSAGRIIADTWSEETVFTAPASEGITGKKRRVSLIGFKIGKNRVNLGGNSRKNIDGCGKITKEYSFGVDGLFKFPASFIIEIAVPYQTSGRYSPDRTLFENRAEAVMREETDGEIVSLSFGWEEDRVVISSHCRENISQIREYT